MSKYNINVDDGNGIKNLSASGGVSLLTVLQKNNYLIPASCAGKGTCQKCKVDVKGRGLILACREKIDGDMNIRLLDLQEYVILDALNAGSKEFKPSSPIQVSRKDDQVTIHYKTQLLDTYSEKTHSINKIFGLAIDIGTTTVVLYLLDIEENKLTEVSSFLNPQTSYGADVISRIEYGINNTDGTEHLQTILLNRLNEEIANVCKKNHLPPDNIYLTAFAGNTVMLHILLNVNPRPISFAPYTPVFTESKELSPMDLPVKMNPNGKIKILPSISGYVGADIVAGVAATDILEYNEYTLYIDIGTNGEIVLGNRDKLYCCATAAGPAFEGANIQCGIGGIPGAISKYREGVYKTIADKKPLGICGSGLVDIVAYLVDEGIVDPSGLLESDFIIAEQAQTSIQQDVFLTQKDIREMQLAKAAIYAGIITVMEIAQVTFNQIRKVYLAGGFGNYIDIENACTIGLLPSELKYKISPIGNGAGTGTLWLLKSMEYEQSMISVLEKMEYIELSTRPDFYELYVSSMTFPNNSKPT